MFTKTLIDDYIEPLIGQPDPVFTGLLRAIANGSYSTFAGMLSTFYIQPHNGHSVTRAYRRTYAMIHLTTCRHCL